MNKETIATKLRSDRSVTTVNAILASMVGVQTSIHGSHGNGRRIIAHHSNGVSVLGYQFTGKAMSISLDKNTPIGRSITARAHPRKHLRVWTKNPAIAADILHRIKAFPVVKSV